MPLTRADHTSMQPCARGFSLIEAVLASAILLLTAAATTGVVTASLSGREVETTQTHLEQRVQAELARLSALPYVLPAETAGPEGIDPAQASSLLEAVFPHALVEYNSARAFFAPASLDQPCTFTTIAELPWGTMRVTGCFMDHGDVAWQPADASAVDGWAVWLDATPPSSAVRITVEAVSTGPRPHRAEATVVLDALRPSIGEQSP